MNTIYKHLRIPLLLFIFAGIAACNKADSISIPEEETIYMPQAVGNRSAVKLMLVDEPYEFSFGAAYGGLKTPGSEISLSFQIEKGLVSEYNTANGTAYELLPDDSYTVSGLTSSIKAGKTTSDPLIISVKSKELVMGGKYLLPVKLASASAGSIDPDLQITYFRVDDVIRKETDVTKKGTLSVSDENTSNPNEVSAKLVDGDINTKYLTFNYTPDLWLQLHFSTPEVLGAYTFTSGNDAPGRDPKTWTLSGSNDGSNWEVLDTRTGESFSGRKQTRFFEFENETPYQYYRVNITERGDAGNGLFQMSEWRVITFK
ncbi:MAG TPA: DUF1735 domain-containing protein [Chitinophagaceae bacterium]|nr:DUF1735 domain-containing protein [Chitinophagaceae bacterium]